MESYTLPKGSVYDFFMSKKRKLCLFILIPVVLFICPNFFVYGTMEKNSIKESAILSKSCALMDGESGRVLYGKNEDEAMANASTTKILTAILVLEKCSPEDMVTISQNAQNQPKVRLGVKEGEEYKVQDLLYAMLLESYNDCAVALAEHVSGSVEAFADLMNEKALELGCEDTEFVTPNGIDSGNHHTTATDLCRIMRYCAWESPKSAEFQTVCQTKNYTFSNGEREMSVTNRNHFLWMKEGVIAGKTGYTAKAGYCYVVAYEKDGKKFCAALLACGWPNHKDYKWKDSERLLSYGDSNYNMEEVDAEEINDTYLTRVKIEDSHGEEYSLNDFKEEYEVGLEIDSTQSHQYLVQGEEALSFEFVPKREFITPIAKGQNAGEIVVRIDEEELERIPVVFAESVWKWDFMELLQLLCEEFTKC